MPLSPPPAREGRGRASLIAAALLVLGAAVIHFAVVSEHLQEYPPYGVFFVVAGLVQVALAGAVLAAPGRRLFLAGAAVSLGLVALWAVSHTTGLPLGPAPGRPEQPGIPDVICVALELAAACLFLLLAGRRARRAAPRRGRLALVTALNVVLIAALTAAGAGAAAGDMPVAFNASPPVPGQPARSVADLVEPPGPQPVDRFTLEARAIRIDGQEAWTYDGTVPGPELRVRQGDRVEVTLINHLPVATTIHWHGLRLPAAADGVAGLTQDAVAPGERYTYTFVARDAGTYWYHSHQETSEQIGRGLFGPLIVLPPEGRVAEDRDYTVVLHGAAGGDGVAANGTAGDLHLDARPGETVRLRLVDAVAPGMDGGPEAPVLLGAPYRVVALDGHDLNAPGVLGPLRIPLGMGQRADLVFTMPAAGAVRLVDTRIAGAPSLFERVAARFGGPSTRPVASVTLGDGPLPPGGDPPARDALPVFDPAAYGSPAPDPVAAGPFDVTAPLVLGEGPGFHDGRVELVHRINGQASPAVPPLTVREGQIVRLHLVNDTGEYHPMHIHGHVFTVLSVDGRPPAGSPLHLDTILVGPHETWDVAFLADNPGLWMVHCHVLLHASFGMSMTVNYAGVSTPYEMGSRSGNVPE
jgi:FtsP/CotA-like multicopper oxidase with cupredoxin domain